MSRAVPHYVTVQDGPGQQVRNYDCESKAEALRFGQGMFDLGHAGAVVSVFRGQLGDNVERDPVKVWA